jgi:hypothetical protein
MWLVWAMACGSGTQELRSAPTEPTVTLAPPAPQAEIVWSNLASLFPDDGPAMPAPLGSLTPGMGAGEAIAALDAARAPGDRIEREEVGGHVVMRSVLRDWTDVAVSLVLDETGERLEQVSLTLPATEALAALGDRWGAPEVTFGAEGRSIYRWRRDGAPWRAALDAVGGDRAVLSYERP